MGYLPIKSITFQVDLTQEYCLLYLKSYMNITYFHKNVSEYVLPLARMFIPKPKSENVNFYKCSIYFKFPLIKTSKQVSFKIH